MDKANVMKALERCSSYDACDDCPYVGMNHCDYHLCEDALALLKANNTVKTNLKLVKACIYRKGNIYFPVAFMASPFSATYDDDQYNGELRVHMLRNGMPATNGCVIIPMGRCPIKGKFEMSLTNFEDILSKYGYHFHCVIPHRDLKDASEVYAAFRWMMYGRNHLPTKGEDNISLKYVVATLCEEGAYMAAIRLYETEKNCSFDEAKDAVDAIVSE